MPLPCPRRSSRRSRADVEPADEYDEEGAAALEEVLTATRTPSAATSISSAPAAAPLSRTAELEALVSQLRAETVQLAEAVTLAEERAELERGFETEESDSGVEPPRQPIRLPWRLHSASSRCTPWCLDWLCSMCKKQPFLLRVLSSDPFNFCVRWATTRQRTGHGHGTPHLHIKYGFYGMRHTADHCPLYTDIWPS